jgi:hypothetical protein
MEKKLVRDDNAFRDEKKHADCKVVPALAKGPNKRSQKGQADTDSAL